MPKPFEKRYANDLVGIFVLMTVAVIVAAVLLGPNTHRWFTPAHKLAIRLPPEGSLGLRKGADVLIMGSVVGSVDDILVGDVGEMEAIVSVRSDFLRFVRGDSKAFIRKPLGIGDASIEITRGRGAPLPADDAMLQASSDKAPTQMMEETLAEIRTELVPAVRELRGAATEYAKLAADLRGQQPAVAEAIGHFNRIGASVEGGQGVVGMLLSDPAPVATIRQLLPKVTASVDNLQGASGEMQTFAKTLPELKQSAQRSLDAMPGLLLQVDETSRQLQRLVELMQHNWLIGGGGSATPSPASDKISVDRVGGGR